MFAYEIKVCMFRNATVFSVQELHTTGKAAPRKLCRLRNVVRVSVTIQVCCLSPKKIRNYGEYTAARTYRPPRPAGRAAALRS